MDSVGAILKVVQAVVNAARTARRNEASCQELAQRVQQVGKLLPRSKAVVRGDATARSILRSLKKALDDALKLVESCGRRRSGCLSWPLVLLTSGGLAAKFADINGRITACLVDLRAANDVRMEEKIDRHAANVEKKIDQLQLAADARYHRRANNSSRDINAINAGKNGNNNNGGWNKQRGQQQQNGWKGGKRRRGKKADGQQRPHGGAGVHFYHVHSMEEDPTSCSVM